MASMHPTLSPIASIFNLWHFSGKNFDSEVRDKDFVFLFKMLIVVGHSSA